MTAALPVLRWTSKRKLPLAIRSKVTFEDAELIADRCFGSLGRQTVALWNRYNHAYFNGVLEPTPVLYVPASPWGAWVGCFIRDCNVYLMYPGKKRSWGFVRGVLLHEMVHQFLSQNSLSTAHAGTPWCQEIMRLSKVFGKNVWAGKYTVRKIRGKSQRINLPNPDENSKAEELTQRQIARWPQSIGVEPPDYVQL